jgi:hypothetical protein
MSDILKKIVYSTLCMYIVFCISLFIWVIIYSGSGDGDTLEHVHSSWLVFRGKVPYKDFFQHHNPLLWYLGAPFVGLFEYSLRAVDAANMLAVTSTIITMFYIYRIHKKILNSILGGLIAIAFFALPQDSLYKVANIENIKLGPAKIKTVISGRDVNEYDINILKITNDMDIKNFVFEITDEKLINLTGGIVQGMSGSPIIQGDYIIGAVTHVTVDNPIRGYGIFITNMLKEAEN